MKHAKTRGKLLAQCRRPRVKTTFLELIGALIDRTAGDAALVASVKRIFATSDVRLARSLAPVRLVAGGQNSTSKLRRTKPAWV